jgi:hypothetical protein
MFRTHFFGAGLSICGGGTIVHPLLGTSVSESEQLKEEVSLGENVWVGLSLGLNGAHWNLYDSRKVGQIQMAKIQLSRFSSC